MPRPKTIRIHAAILKVWQDLSNELRDHPLFKNCEFSSIHIVSKKRMPDPVIKDVDKPITRLERFIINNGNQAVKNRRKSQREQVKTMKKWKN